MNEQLNIFEIFEDPKIKKEIDELREKIRYYNVKYHEEDIAEISDFEYDKLTSRLRKLEEENPQFVTKDSPTQKVGGSNKKIFEQVIHEVQMQSLQDVFNFEDVASFVKKVMEEYGENTEFVVETKIDGLSVSLEYEDGKLVRGSTRGNGFVGEDVTSNLKCIEQIPHELNSKDTVEVRGEVYLSRKNFEKVNEELEQKGKPILSNPRNAAAGTLRQLDTELVKSRNLSIFVFNIQKGLKFSTHTEGLNYLEEIGFKILENRFLCVGEEQVIKAIEKIGKMRDNLEYDIDGAVVKVNDLHIREEMGSTVKVPKWAVAYKYPPEQKETKVLDIIVQVGRTGQITPMAVLEPVRVAGSVISKTTLHNFDYIKQKDIRIGDTVIIEKAGDVIPEVNSVVITKRNGNEIEYEAPNDCPVCGDILEKEEGFVAYRCTNSECPALLYRSIVHFASREAMDISGLGESIVELLIDKELIKDMADIYYIKYEDVINFERFADKSVNNLIQAISDTKNNSLDKLIFGLGIRHIGKKAAKILALNFEDIYEIMNADVERINQLDDFGMTMAESLVTFFSKEETRHLIEKFEKASVNLKGSKVVLKSKQWIGKTFCITGSFDEYTRDEIVSIIEENGGKSSTTVTKKTDYLIAGENAGSKLTKASDLGIEVINIEEFLEMLASKGE